jgi:hypothetical protein
MAFTIDERPTVIGNKIIITGTYTAGGAQSINSRRRSRNY